MVVLARNFIQVNFIYIIEHYKDQLGLMYAGKYLLMDAWNRTNTVY
jgi:hypothetical protein